MRRLPLILLALLVGCGGAPFSAPADRPAVASLDDAGSDASDPADDAAADQDGAPDAVPDDGGRTLDSGPVEDAPASVDAAESGQDAGAPVCSPGAMQSCNTFGSQLCTASGWGPCSCPASPVCAPGSVRDAGACTCDACGQWDGC